MAEINPMRYRGYYYDSDTGMYYLQSRYYDPSLKRFINADAYVDTGTGVLGANMFAYCENDVVNRYDPDGYDAIWLQDTNGVYGFGHSGLLLQDKNKVWFYFYWGNYDVQCIKLNSYKYVDKNQLNKYLVDKKIYGSKIAQYKKTYVGNGKRKHVSLKLVGYTYDAFESIRYFSGDFTKSLSMANAYVTDYYRFFRANDGKNKQYNLLHRNCAQVSAYIMSCTNSKYKKKFEEAKSITIPNKMFDIIKGW